MIRYHRFADPPFVQIISDDGSFVDVPLAEFEADPQAAVASKTPIADARKETLANLADMRWQKTQSFVYDGVETPCNDGARAALLGAVVGLQLAQSNGPITWKLAEGVFRSWTLAELVAFGQAMRTYVQACFDTEAALSAQVEAAPTSLDVVRIDTSAGWPVVAVADPITP